MAGTFKNGIKFGNVFAKGVKVGSLWKNGVRFYEKSMAGQNWFVQNANNGLNNNMFILYKPNLFVMPSYDRPSPYDNIQTSPDGITWTKRQASDTGMSWQTGAYGNNMFSLHASQGLTNRSNSTSPDGITWTYRNQVLSGGLMTFSRTNFIMASGSSILTSPTGYLPWTTRVFPFVDPGIRLAAGNDRVVAINMKNTVASQGFVAISLDDGITWTLYDFPEEVRIQRYGFAGGLFFAIAYNTAPNPQDIHNVFYTSPDGITWTKRMFPITVRSQVCEVPIFGDGTYVFSRIDSMTQTYMLTTTDFVEWTHVLLPVTNRRWYSGGGQFQQGKFIVSTMDASQVLISQ